jgi:hypothetical protein
MPGPNPTTSIYNASVVKINNAAMYTIAWRVFILKIIFLRYKNALAYCNADAVAVNEKSCRIGSWKKILRCSRDWPKGLFTRTMNFFVLRRRTTSYNTDKINPICVGRCRTTTVRLLLLLLLLLWTPSLRSRLVTVRPLLMGPSPWVLSWEED